MVYPSYLKLSTFSREYLFFVHLIPEEVTYATSLTISRHSSWSLAAFTHSANVFPVVVLIWSVHRVGIDVLTLAQDESFEINNHSLYSLSRPFFKTEITFIILFRFPGIQLFFKCTLNKKFSVALHDGIPSNS